MKTTLPQQMNSLLETPPWKLEETDFKNVEYWLKYNIC